MDVFPEGGARAFDILIADHIDKFQTLSHLVDGICVPQETQASDVTTSIVEIPYHSLHLLVC